MALKRTTHSGINDEGDAFVIVPQERKIIVPSTHKVIGTRGEHRSEQVTIKCPVTIDGHDIPHCQRKYITWENNEKRMGTDELSYGGNDGEFAIFYWTIGGRVTSAVGPVSFSVSFEDLDIESNSEILYKFNTTKCIECEILDTLSASTIGTYESIYENNGFIVFNDYTPVFDGFVKIVSVN